jgi:uncharacterized protein (UPF0333 family)
MEDFDFTDMIRAQSSNLYLILAAAVVLAGVALGFVVFTGGLQSGDAGTGQETAILTTTPTSTQTSTTSVTPTPSPTSTPTPTPTPSPTPTPAPTPTPEPDPYDDFRSTIAGVIAEGNTPVRVRGWEVTDDDGTFLIAYNRSTESNLTAVRERNIIASSYAQTLLWYDQGKISGEAPSGMRILELETDGVPETYYVNNSLSRKYGSGQIKPWDFDQAVADTGRVQSIREQKWARNLDRTGGNVTLGPNGNITYPDEK